MKNIILLAFLLLNIISCSSTENVPLTEDVNVTSIYSKKEISSLELILDFFDAFILERVQTKSIDIAYHKYFKSLQNVKSLEEFKDNIELSSNNLNDLLENLKDDGIFNEIWQYEYGIDYKTKDTLSVCLIPNIQGKHIELLEIIGNKNNDLKKYVNSIKECACIPSSVIAGFNNNHGEFDFQKDINRLIWAIHYITIISEEKSRL